MFLLCVRGTKSVLVADVECLCCVCLGSMMCDVLMHVLVWYKCVSYMYIQCRVVSVQGLGAV